MRGHIRPRPDRGPDAFELIVDAGRDPLTKRRRQRSKLVHGGRRHAEDELRAFIDEVTTARHGPEAEAPLTDLVEAWLLIVADDLAPSTLNGYRRILRTQIAPAAIGSTPIGEVTTPAIDAFYRDLGQTRAPATVRQTHAVLRRAFRQAVRWGWLATNPAAEATPPRVRRPKITPPDPAKVAALLAAATDDDPAMGVLFRTAATTGARRGELAGLRWSRLDLEVGEMLIDQAVSQVGRSITIKDPKTHQARRVTLDAGTVAALKAHRKHCAALALEAGVPWDPDPYVWAADVDGAEPLAPDVIGGRFRRLAKVHAPGCRLHDLRHFAATQLLAAGVPVKTVSGRLGHGSAAMTLDVYGHHVAAADRGAADTLGALLDGAG